MADVIHKTTLEERRSVNTGDYQNGDWLVVSRTALDAIPAQYRKVVGGQLVEMSEAEKAQVDASAFAQAVEAKALAMFKQAIAFVESYYPPSIQTAAQNLMLDAQANGYTQRAQTLSQISSFGFAVMAAYRTARDAALSATNTQELEAVTLDLSGITAPSVDVAAQAEVME